MSNINNQNPNPSPSLLDPYVKITLGNVNSNEADIFTVGDGKLKTVSVTLGEGKVQSNCRFTVYDPDKKLINKYLAYIERVGGLDPVEAPEETQQTPSVSSNGNSTVDDRKELNKLNVKAQIESKPGNFTQDASLPINVRAFLDVIAYAENSGYAALFEKNGGYNIMFTGKTFNSFADHPKKKFKSGSLVSNAAGRYQFLSGPPSPTWENAKKALNLPDFSPISQDKAAVWLIQQRGAYNDILQGSFDTAISKLNTEWASLPGSPYGQPTKPLNELREYYKQRLQVYQGGTLPSSNAKDSAISSQAPQVENTPTAKTLSGAQITIELGYAGKTISAYSFIHTGLKYSLFEPNSLEFTGQAASWVLTQRIKNTVYKDITFRKLAQKITSSYGMKLVMPEDGPKYAYFPQRGQTDYEALLIEARRIGYRVYTKGATLYIQPRKGIDPNKQVFILEYGVNMGTFFEVTHQASTDSKGGARSSQPGSNNSTGERKFEIDPDTGQVKQKRKENVVGTGSNLDASISGSPLPYPAPKTTGETDSSDSQRKTDEDRIKGIIANTEFPTTPEALTLDPDTPFKTQGISTTLDRFWVVDNITHDYEGGKFTTRLTCYSPMKNKKATADINNNQVNSSSNPVVEGNNAAFDPNAPKFIRPTPGVITSKHRTENGRRPNHKGIDYGDPVGTPTQAAAAGTVTTASFGWNGGYGTLIKINHGNGWETRYSHLSQIAVTQGQQVTQGQIIGKTGNTGRSSG